MWLLRFRRCRRNTWMRSTESSRPTKTMASSLMLAKALWQSCDRLGSQRHRIFHPKRTSMIQGTRMPDRIFVDTSFVLALINERDQHHDQAETLSFKFEQSFLITTVAVLLEIGNALAKDFRRQANAVLKLLRTSNRVEVVNIDDQLLEKA